MYTLHYVLDLGPNNFISFVGKVNNITVDKCTKVGIVFKVSVKLVAEGRGQDVLN
jgi:hypothetical protein